MDAADLPTLDDLESLFVNNVDLHAIRDHLSQFNPIKTMGMERMEIRHSAILAWLLNPQQTHGLRDAFLKAFLSEALRRHDGALCPTALDVSQADMMDAEVRREWRDVDLLILSQRNGWVFIIENKFDSKQHSNQLQKYMDVVKTAVIDGEIYHDLRGIFLTLWDEEPEDERYAPVAYSEICRLLEQVAFSGRTTLTPEVRTFLKHYLNVILEVTGMSTAQSNMERLARQLYRDHRRVLDFIVEHGKRTDFITACEAVFGKDLEHSDIFEIEGQQFVYFASAQNLFSLMPKSWFDGLGEGRLHWDGCEKWWHGFPVIMWVQLTGEGDGGKGQIRVFAEVGPLSDHDFRRELIEGIGALSKSHGLNRIRFQRGAADEGKKYSKFLKNNFFSVGDVQDHDQISNAIKKALTSFKSEIKAVAEILPRFRQYGREAVSE